jgi:Alginate lyase
MRLRLSISLFTLLLCACAAAQPGRQQVHEVDTARQAANSNAATRQEIPQARADTAAPYGFELLTLSAQALTVSAQRIRAGDPAAVLPFNALIRRADRALNAPLRSVTDKSTVPPSGSKNDYISMGPYWWPNPSSASGLPYIQRDGQRNPEVMGNAMDSDRMQNMAADSRDLALAYRFTGDSKYAKRAADVLRTWFINPATRMNPHLRFGQSVPGVAQGRGIGIIDTRDLWMVMDAVVLIKTEMNSSELKAIRQWFADYAHWMDTSELGKDEAAAKNNHGMFFDAQLVAYWMFVGEFEKARELAFRTQTNRFARQIDRDGRMPLELARTRPFHYHTFTLEAMTRLARYSDLLSTRYAATGQLPLTDAKCSQPESNIQCPIELWQRAFDGKSLRGVLDTVANVAIAPQSWKFTTPIESAPVLGPALPVLLMAHHLHPNATFENAINALSSTAPEHLAWLLWPKP